jgi:hypothetical protein
MKSNFDWKSFFKIQSFFRTLTNQTNNKCMLRYDVVVRFASILPRILNNNTTEILAGNEITIKT